MNKNKGQHWNGDESQWYLISDDERIDVFEEALSRVLKEDRERVCYDLGAGSGILSLLLAKYTRGVVYSVEIDDRLIPGLERVFSKHKEVLKGRMEILCDDARTLENDNKADVIVNELLSTGLIGEPQVLTMNNARENLLKPEGIVIPQVVETYATLVNFPYFSQAGFHMDNIIPHLYGYDRQAIEFSNRRKYHEADFTNRVDPLVQKRNLEFEIEKSGEINGIMLTSEAEMIKGSNLRLGTTKAVFPKMVLPLDKPISVKKGEIIYANIKYEMGKGTSTIETSVGSYR